MKKHFRTARCLLGLTLLLAAESAFAVDGDQSATQSNSRYLITSAEVYDKISGLAWQRCSVGQHWADEKVGCVGAVATYTFDDAQKLGAGGWRVPTVEELKTLIDFDRKAQGKQPVIDEHAFPGMDRYQYWYWSSTPGGDTGGWVVLFNSGLINSAIYYRGNTGAVRMVK
jgi:hypothetical protein